MKKRGAVAGFTFLGTLIVLNYLPSILTAIILLGFLFVFSLVFYLLKKQYSDISVFLITLSSFFAVALFSFFYLYFYIPAVKLDGAIVHIKAQIADEPITTEYGKMYYLSPITSNLNDKDYPIRGKILLYTKSDFSAKEFDIVEGDLKLSRFEEKSDYDALRQNRAKGVYLSGKQVSDLSIEEPKGKPIYYYAVAIRKFIRANIEKYVGGDYGALTNGIVLGDKSNIPQSIKDNFQQTGLSHALAVSGIHISFLVAFIIMLFDFLGKKRRNGYIFCIVASVLVMSVTGFSPSVMRAGLMSLIFFSGALFYKESDPINSMGLAVLILCAQNPFSAVDVGLLLSLTATIGILYISVPLSNKIKGLIKFKRFKRIMNELIGAVTATIGATLLTLPILIIFIGKVSTVSILSNLLAVFPVSVCFILGIFTAIFSFFSPLAYVFGFLTKGVAWYLIFVTSKLSNIGFSYIYAKMGFVFIWLLFIAILAAMYFFFRKREKPRVVIAISLSVIVLCSGIFTNSVSSSYLMEICVVDVGSGDSLAIIKDNKAIVIDCGGVGNPSDRMLDTLEKNSVNTIETVIISHFHDDHAGDADDLINDFNVKNVILPPYDDEGNLREDILLVAEQKGTNVIIANEDINIKMTDEITLSVLTKHLDKEVTKNDDFNVNSLVVVANYKDFSCLFTGDIEFESETKLLSEYGGILDCDVLKVAHHGSVTSSSATFLSVATPGTAIISVGNNSYGHPSNYVLERLINIGAKIYSTKDSGTVNIYSNGTKEYTVIAER